MRFIKLETGLDNPDSGTNIEFNNKTDIFLIRDQKKFGILKKLFSGIIFSTADVKESAGENINFNLHISYNDIIYRLDSKGNITEEGIREEDPPPDISPHISLDQYINIFSNKIYSAISYIEVNDTTADELFPRYWVQLLLI